jgi:hypothetical protein
MGMATVQIFICGYRYGYEILFIIFGNPDANLTRCPECDVLYVLQSSASLVSGGQVYYTLDTRTVPCRAVCIEKRQPTSSYCGDLGWDLQVPTH